VDHQENAPAVSFNRQGPFYRLQRRLGLLSDTDLAAIRRASVFALLAWVPLLVLAAMQGYAWSEQRQRAILFDYTVYASVIAIFLFILMEQTSEQRMTWLVHQFVTYGILPEKSQVQIAHARQVMGRRTDSWIMETALLVAAYLLSYVMIRSGVGLVEGGRWFGRSVEGGMELTLCGWWLLLVTRPLFLFLLARWLWRFIAWALLLRDLARCELQLVATHPDRCGGLSFIGAYPKTFQFFIFSVSLVIAASMLNKVVYAGASPMSFKYGLLAVIVLLVVAFVLPLFAFRPVLRTLKKQGLNRYGVIVSQHHLAFEGKWIGREGIASAPATELLGSPDVSSLADLSASYDIIRGMQRIPVTKQSIIPLLIAALLPFIVAAATQVPLKVILGAIKDLLL